MLKSISTLIGVIAVLFAIGLALPRDLLKSFLIFYGAIAVFGAVSFAVYWLSDKTGLSRWIKGRSPVEKVGWFFAPSFFGALVAYGYGWQDLGWCLSLLCVGSVSYVLGWRMSERYTVSLICLGYRSPTGAVSRTDVDSLQDHLEARYSKPFWPHQPYCPCSQCKKYPEQS